VNVNEAVTGLNAIFQRFSSWHRLKKFVARSIRCQTSFRNRTRERKECKSSVDSNYIDPITVEEMKIAELEILKCVQRQAFQEELNAL
jgi:hypothetical protein